MQSVIKLISHPSKYELLGRDGKSEESLCNSKRKVDEIVFFTMDLHLCSFQVYWRHWHRNVMEYLHWGNVVTIRSPAVCIPLHSNVLYL